MKKLRDYVRKNPHVAISIPAILCAMTFVTNLCRALQDGFIDQNELQQLQTTADGFEAVVLFFVTLALRNRK